MNYRYNVKSGVTRLKTNTKKYFVGAISSLVMVGGMAVPTLAAPPTNPGTYGTAALNAQCDTGASSGAFNAHNAIYGPNSSEFGQAGGSGGGQTGLNNSAVCGNRPSN